MTNLPIRDGIVTEAHMTHRKLVKSMDRLLSRVVAQHRLVQDEVLDHASLSRVLRNIPIDRILRRIGDFYGTPCGKRTRDSTRAISSSLVERAIGVLALRHDPSKVKTWWIDLRCLYGLLLARVLPVHPRGARAGSDVHRLLALCSSLCGCFFISSHPSIRVVDKMS